MLYFFVCESCKKIQTRFRTHFLCQGCAWNLTARFDYRLKWLEEKQNVNL